MSIRPNPSSGVCYSQSISKRPTFRSLHRLLRYQSLNTGYRRVVETKDEAKRGTGWRNREEVVREAFLQVAVCGLQVNIRKWALSRMEGRVWGREDYFSIWWPSGMMSFLPSTSPGFSLSGEEKRNTLPLISYEAIWLRRSRVNTHCLCLLINWSVSSSLSTQHRARYLERDVITQAEVWTRAPALSDNTKNNKDNGRVYR